MKQNNEYSYFRELRKLFRLNKKTLRAGSITATIIILLASLTSVVGIQTINSTTKHESPLFTVRTAQATQKTDSYYTTTYLKKEKTDIISLPELKNTMLIRNKAQWLLNNMKRNTQLSKQIETLIGKVRNDHQILQNMQNLFETKTGKIDDNQRLTGLKSCLPTECCTGSPTCEFAFFLILLFVLFLERISEGTALYIQ